MRARDRCCTCCWLVEMLCREFRVHQELHTTAARSRTSGKRPAVVACQVLWRSEQAEEVAMKSVAGAVLSGKSNVGP